MIYERLPSLPFPHGAEPLLADSVDFLEVASLAGTIPSALDYRYPKKDLQRSQMLYDSILPELEQPNFLATRDREGTIVGTAAYHINPERRFMHLDILSQSIRSIASSISAQSYSGLPSHTA